MFGNGFSLAEGNSLLTQNTINVALGGSGKRTLDFDVAANFDKSDTKSFGKDRVAVYLVDSNNQPIAIDSTHPGGVPLFSLSETGAEIIPGLVKFDGTHVQIDVSNISTLTSGKLVVQLLNQDGDSGSNVSITNLVDSIDPNGTPGTSVNPAITPVTPGAAKILDSYMATNNAQLLLSNVSLDKVTGKYTADLRVQNVGTTTLSQNLAVLLTNLPTGVTVANSSGTHPAGSAYLNFDTAIAPGGLAGGAISDAVRVVINDPSLAAFSFKPVVLQGAMAVLPDLSSLATLTVKVGDKIDIPLGGELAIQTTTKLPTGKITGDSHLVFTPAPDQIGSYTFTLIARNGSTSTRQNITLNVVADPITTTRVTGIIADTNQAGLAGVLVELSGYQATTDSSGKFTIILPESSAGDTLKVYGQRIQGGGITYPFIAEKMGLLLGHDIYRGVNNQIDRPIYLPTIDVTTGTTVNPAVSTFVTNPRLVGAKVAVAANSLFDKSGNAFAGIMSITEVPPSLTPAALPENLHPDLVVTIQPGDMVFNTPALLTLGNRGGYLPGLELDLWSINPNTGLFDIVGKGKVSADGTVIETIEGGIRNSSWHFFSSPPPPPPPPSINLGANNPSNPNPNKGQCELTNSFKSEVSAFSGAVSDNRALVSYQSQGLARGVNLHYDSLRANPTEIIHIGGQASAISPADKFSAKVTLTANGISQTVTGLKSSQLNGLTGGERMWSVPATGGTFIDASIQVDVSHLGSGQYQYQTDTGIRGIRSWTNPDNSVTIAVLGTTANRQDKLVVVNDSDSVFGSGWNVSGLQKIVVNEDKSVLLIDGDGTHQVFALPLVQAAPNTPQIYLSAPGDYSQLTRLADGTFQRTMKDFTRYQFNAQGLMIAATDREGNTTRHIYNASGQIQQIIDPVGLTTTFNYTGNRVSSIVDPAGRITTMEYDSQGNLVSVTDPDGSKNQYGYDSRHLLTSSIDKTGQVKTGTYDEFGRAKSATREDGSIVQINPIAVQGLRNEQQTINLAGLPTAQIFKPNPISTYVDANGNTVSSQLDNKGHVSTSTDSIGTITTNIRDTAGNITRTIDGQGNLIDYTYDSKGNLTTIKDIIPTSISALQPSFREAMLLSLPAPGVAKVAATGDINKDGYLDIITTANNGKLNVLLGDSTGSFTNTYTIDTAPFTQSSVINQLELKDVNNDGQLDIIANLPIDQYTPPDVIFQGRIGSPVLLDPVLVFLNQGGGQFSSANILPLLAKSDGFVTGDFNGDGKLDIVVRSDIRSANLAEVYPLVLYTGDGTGNFVEESISIPGIDGTSQFYNGFNTVAADFNQDGKTELVFSLFDRLSVYGYDSNGTWSEIYRDTSNSGGRFTVGDLNNDGKLDIIRSNSNKIQLLAGNNDNSFQSQILNIPNFNSSGFSRLEVADINGDERLELVATTYNSIEIYSLDDSQQLFQLKSPIQIKSISGNNYLRMADIDGNGSLDLLFDSVSPSTIGVVKDFYKDPLSSTTSYTVPRTNNGYPNTLTKSYTYDSKFNQLTSVTDELGRTTSYSLDLNTGNVVRANRQSRPNGETVNTSYTYTARGLLDLVTNELGQITDYDYDNYDRLIKTTTALGTLDQTVDLYEYDLAGNQTASIDALGRRTTYTYNSMNMLLQTNDALGGITTYTYDRMGHQTSMTDSLGHVTKMTYDRRGRLENTIDANGGTTLNTYDNNGNLVGIKDALGRITSYAYDLRNRLISSTSADGGVTGITYDLNNKPIAITDSLGHKTQNFYDSRNRLIREVDALGHETKYSYNAANELIGITDAKGNVTSYFYDLLGRQTAEFKALTQSAGGSTSIPVYLSYVSIPVTNAVGYAIRNEYDKLGNITATIDPNGNRTEYQYDNLNRRVRVKDALGKTNTTSYDKVGNILSTTDRLGHTTSYNYDALNRQISVTDALNSTSTVSYNAVGNILSTTDALRRITSYTYDNLNRRVTSTDALNQTQTISYDAVGNVLTSTDRLGRITSYGYDNRDRQITTTDALNQTNSTSYDLVGNVKSTTDELGRITKYSYDADNRLITTTDALNQQQSIVYDKVDNIVSTTDELGRTTTYTYDNLDRRTGIIDPLGHTSTYSYDGVGNTLTSSDALGNTTTYQYDNLNRQIKVIDAKGGITNTAYNAVGNTLSITDSVGNITSYSYDQLNRQLTDTNSLGKTRSYSYDAVGNQLSLTDRNGRKLRYSYDALNRLTTENWLNANNQITDTITTSYDAVGNVIASGDINSQYGYSYDAIDRITAVDNQGTPSVPRVILNYAYDAAGNLTSTTDTINNQLKGTLNYTYDTLNRLTKLTQTGVGVSGKRVDMNYDAGNQMTSLNRYSDVLGANLVASSLYTYDSASRLTSINYQRANNTMINSFSYTYDSANRLTQETSTDGTSNYSYDATNQLTSTDNTNQADEAYSYDANGNRTNGSYGTGTNNQLLTDGKFNYQYDEGNRTRKVEIATGEVTSYGWDYRNRLISVTVADVNGVVIKSVAYTYDVNNRRIGKVVDNDGVGAAAATVERFVYDGNQIGLVFDAQGNQTHRYLYGAGVDQILADETVTGTNWAVTDKLGTVTDVIDNNGVVLNHIVYDSFGSVVTRSDTSFEFRYGFTGREYDGETGLDYYRARYYDSGNGRFIGEDPIGFAAGDGNLTRYVGNSPTNWTDPNGLEAITVPSGGLGLGGLLEGAAGLFGAIRKYGLPIGTGVYILNLTDPITSQQAEEDAITEADKNKDPNKQPKPVPVPVPDPNCSEEVRKKEEDERRKKCKSGKSLYRGDSRNPLVPDPLTGEIIFVNGFTPRGTNAKFEDHVNFKPKDSAFISTSTKKQVGIDFATDFRKRDGYLYEICDPGEELGKNIRRDAQTIYNNKRYGGRHEFAYQKEIAFKGGIPAKYIIQSTYYSQNQKSGSVFFNPTYNP